MLFLSCNFLSAVIDRLAVCKFLRCETISEDDVKTAPLPMLIGLLSLEHGGKPRDIVVSAVES
jgi:hypothetical protein